MSVYLRENPFIQFFDEYVLPGFSPSGILGISIAGVSQVVPGRTFARLYKKKFPETHIVIGGSIFTHLADRLKEWPEAFGLLFDSVVIYEGEIPLLELCRCIEKGSRLEAIPNLIYKKDSLIKENPLCTPKPMDMMPTPFF
ncbi:MAG: hypothetical protein E3K37_00280 [Candidatus Kuenenia sp.]|nr:hypothetical protein [Candidatus Kuenenia hertensis]